MSASAISTDAAFSNFTIALLKDTGYYESVREYPNDNLIWGKEKGCSFVNKACYNTNFNEFCTES